MTVFQAASLVIVIIGLGGLFAYASEMADLFRQRLELDERFNHTDELIEDLETQVISLQIDLTNLMQEVKRKK